MVTACALLGGVGYFPDLIVIAVPPPPLPGLACSIASRELAPRYALKRLPSWYKYSPGASIVSASRPHIIPAPALSSDCLHDVSYAPDAADGHAEAKGKLTY